MKKTETSTCNIMYPGNWEPIAIGFNKAEAVEYCLYHPRFDKVYITNKNGVYLKRLNRKLHKLIEKRDLENIKKNAGGLNTEETEIDLSWLHEDIEYGNLPF